MNNTLSNKLNRIDNAVSSIRETVSLPNAEIEDVALAVQQLPSGGGTTIYNVASIAERDALSPNEGDLCNLRTLGWGPAGRTITAGTPMRTPSIYKSGRLLQPSKSDSAHWEYQDEETWDGVMVYLTYNTTSENNKPVIFVGMSDMGMSGNLAAYQSNDGGYTWELRNDYPYVEPGTTMGNWQRNMTYTCTLTDYENAAYTRLEPIHPFLETYETHTIATYLYTNGAWVPQY